MGEEHPEKEDVIGAWSEDKLQLLEKYLKAYSTIMNNQKKKWLKAYHYIDAFAGSGRPKAKSDVKKYVEGSPLRALQCKPPFDYYKFIELSPWRIKKLEDLQKQFPHLDIEIIPGDCNDVLFNKIITQITNQSEQRGLVFLDPFGLQVNFETIRALAEAGTFDVFINFPVMAIIRNLRLDEYPTEHIKTLIDGVLGNSEWMDELYKFHYMLFEGPVLRRGPLRAEWIARKYCERISSLFPNVSHAVIMKNSQNAPLYALFLASHNQTAVKIVNDIFKNYDRLKTNEYLKKFLSKPLKN